MNGIVGVFERDGSVVDDGLLERMMAKLAHRGRDDSGTWIDGRIVLGQQSTHTTPEAKRTSPPVVTSGCAIVADGRVDDRSAVRSTPNSSVRSEPSDTELFLDAYDRWGGECPDELCGAFAFTVWDESREQVFCARDPLGIRPLYYHVTEDRFAFASEPKALKLLQTVNGEPDSRRIGHYLVGDFDGGSRTFYEGIRRLPPGHAMIVTEESAHVRQYWTPDPTRELQLPSDEAYERRFRELFTEAIRCRLRSSGPVGSFLSGGIDSSSIVTVARDVLADSASRAPLRTFSAVFDDVTVCDEREYIEPVLESGTFEPHFVPGDRIPPLKRIDSHLWHQDAPFYPSMFMLIWELLHEAKSQGVDIVLNGYGGDQTLCSLTEGYPRELARSMQFRSLVDTLRSYHRRYPELTYPRLLRNEVLVPQLPEWVRRVRHVRTDPDEFVNRTLFPIDREFARSIDLGARLKRDAISRPPRSHRAVHRRSLRPGEPTFNLERSAMASAALGVEMRFPYFDRRLVDFCLALPPEQKVRDGLGRSIARRALAGVLPPEVRRRDTKMEFSANVVHGVRRYELERIEETLFDRPTFVDRYVDFNRVLDAYDQMQDGGTQTDARTLLMAATLEQWLQHEGKTRRDDWTPVEP